LINVEVVFVSISAEHEFAALHPLAVEVQCGYGVHSAMKHGAECEADGNGFVNCALIP
jgi:hypothetical protein